MDAGGVVRNIQSRGTRNLPQRMRRHGNYHEMGEYVFCFAV
jgi:small subunit ribosomal protein S6